MKFGHWNGGLWIWFITLVASVQLVAQAASLVRGPRVEFTNGVQAVVRWSTDVSTGSRVFFGESTERMTRRANGEQGVDHVVVLPALQPGTQWSFTVGTARF